MAIAFARREFLSRRSNDSAARKLAYNLRSRLADARTGEVFDYTRDHDPALHSEISLPPGAPELLKDAQRFADALEAAERRKDAQIGQDILYALPKRSDVPDLTDSEYTTLLIDMSRRVVAEQWTTHGLAAAWSIHTGDTDDANPHLHVVVSTRRLGPEGFDRHKARDLMPSVAGGRVDPDGFGRAWGEWQQRYFAERGLAVKVDEPRLVSQAHLGPRRFRDPSLDPSAESSGGVRDLMDEPADVVRALCATKTSFTREDLEAHLAKIVPDHFVSGWADAILADKEAVELFDTRTSRSTGRYVSRELRSIEERVLGQTLALLKAGGHSLSEKAKAAGLTTRTLRADQLEAFNAACGDAALVVIVGKAGVGKSYSAAAIRDAHLAGGYRVLGASLANSVVRDMRTDGFDAMTLHAIVRDIEKGALKLNRRTMVLIDEAGMADTRILDKVLAYARAAGAKVIMQGDPRQLPSVGAGGLFKWVVERHPTAEIRVITRQKSELERAAAQELSEGKIAAAIRRLEAGRRLEWSQTQEESARRLVEDWKRSYDADHKKRRLVLAFTNRDGDRLNQMIREHLRARGELRGPEHVFELKTGKLRFAVNDLVQITTTDKNRGLVNGDVGRIQKIDGPLIYVLINGQVVVLDTREFKDLRGGWVSTVHKSQGKTVAETFVYHSDHWRAAATYVALSRQVERVKLYVSRDLNPTIERLIQKVGRRDRADMSLAEGVTADQLIELRKRDARQKVAPAALPSRKAPDPLPPVLRQRASATLKTAAPRPSQPPAKPTASPRPPYMTQIGRELREIADRLDLRRRNEPKGPRPRGPGF